jgi:uncharacterized protein (TIGR02284 family)
MPSANTEARRKLDYLYQICKAGERGFAVAAANVANRGLKIILKAYAQQRGQFADELQRESRRLGGSTSEGKLLFLLGMIHRGRIDIWAALTIGAQNVENVVLSEALLGENAAVSVYQRAQAGILPDETRALLEQQYRQVAATRDEVALLRGQSGKRLVVRLFDSDRDVEAAMQALERVGFARDSIELRDAKLVTGAAPHRGDRVTETIVSGAVGGALWGSLIGGLAGLSVQLIPEMPSPIGGGPQTLGALIALGGIVIGACLAAFLGMIIGASISEEDVYLYNDSVKHGVRLVRLHTDSKRAEEAAQIMRQINAAARAHTLEGTLPTPRGQ